MIEKRVSRVILYNQEGAILLGRRSSGLGEGQFALVGGKPDEGESDLQAAIRETEEELGITPEPVFWKRQDNPQAGTDVIWLASYFYALLVGEPKPNEEIGELIYVQAEDLDQLPIAFDHRERLQEFFQSGILNDLT